MVEKHVDPEVFAANLDRVLASNECKPHAELEKEPPQMFQEPGLQFSLAGILREREEVEVVWVLEYLLRQVRLRRRQGSGEVRTRSAARARCGSSRSGPFAGRTKAAPPLILSSQGALCCGTR